MVLRVEELIPLNTFVSKSSPNLLITNKNTQFTPDTSKRPSSPFSSKNLTCGSDLVKVTEEYGGETFWQETLLYKNLWREFFFPLEGRRRIFN